LKKKKKKRIKKIRKIIRIRKLKNRKNKKGKSGISTIYIKEKEYQCLFIYYIIVINNWNEVIMNLFLNF